MLKSWRATLIFGVVTVVSTASIVFLPGHRSKGLTWANVLGVVGVACFALAWGLSTWKKYQEQRRPVAR
jgi:hypothetical protein